jgi:S-DNA-T family DNA segregation ATPase FtsK/SpoIIIE
MARAARKRGLDRGLEIAGAVWTHPLAARGRGALAALAGVGLAAALVTWNVGDPSLNASTAAAPANVLGALGANLADLLFQGLGLAGGFAALLLLVLGLSRLTGPQPDASRTALRLRALGGGVAMIGLAALLAWAPAPASWPLPRGLGGLAGDSLLNLGGAALSEFNVPFGRGVTALLLGALGAWGMIYALALPRLDLARAGAGLAAWLRSRSLASAVRSPFQADPEPATPAPPARARRPKATTGPGLAAGVDPGPEAADLPGGPDTDDASAPVAIRPPKTSRESGRETREAQGLLDFARDDGFTLPELSMLARSGPRAAQFDEAALRQNAQLLEGVLSEFGVRGQIDQIRPGPVVTLYELVPAPGVKSARVVALADDIARSMSVAACRVAVVPGRNAIGIELPNARRETVYLRDLLSSPEYEKTGHALPMALGENIGGEPYIADLAKMPHLLIAGTTGSGKSVGVNAMILSILYRLPPEACRFIMIDPKMLELSVYDGIPHLLAPVVTDPKKAIVALKWTVREMEDRYRLMSKIGVRNVASYNERAREAAAKGEHFERTVQTGFDDQGRPVYESERIDPRPMPYLVVVIDEVADLMMVAGKDVEGAVQRLAQMARAAGIHLVMATQRPSVDVITGTIKANFPTRISFQVTSRIDSRTILGEQGAEQLLGQGDMLYMAGGGRITRLHGPFVSDGEVEAVARFLRDQGQPQYLEEVTAGGDDEEGDGEFGGGEGGSGDDLYDRAVAVVTRDGKASTSYVQRRLQIGYNRAASLIERMEREGVVSPANHAGKREILAPPPP